MGQEQLEDRIVEVKNRKSRFENNWRTEEQIFLDFSRTEKGQGNQTSPEKSS